MAMEIREDDWVVCCGSSDFAKLMVKASPFSSLETAIDAAREIWLNQVNVPAWLEAFAAHPQIGNSPSPSNNSDFARRSVAEQSTAFATTSASALEELSEWNALYRQKFGFIFIICASGRTHAEMLAELKGRYSNRPIVELEIAAKEQMKITELRIAKLFSGRNPESVQEKVLGEILSRNSNTEYLKRFHLNGSSDRKTFKTKVPVVTYEDLKPDIQRISNGDRSPILSSHPINEFLTSSGTSAGERKLMPTIEEDLDRRQLLYSLLMPVMNLYVPGLDKGKGLYFLFVKSESKTSGGLPARPVLTSYYKSDHFRRRPYDPYNDYTSPNEAILCSDSSQSMYAQMLCGLLMRHDVLRLGAVFASGLLRAISFLQNNWKELARDIATGTLSSRIFDPAIKNRMLKILTKPDQELAEFLIEVCSRESWGGIITKIWPNTKYLDVIVTGAMAQYIPTLEYYSGGLPMACTMYASSESYFGINLKPMCKPSEVSYTIMPNMAYFEFIPHDQDGAAEAALDETALVELADVELGKEYELVITTYAGLCRYRVGDILRVTGFHNSAPQFKFIRRKNVLLSIESDKTDEAELQKAVENASRLIAEQGMRVIEYTSYAETKTIPGHYVIYWELLGNDQTNACPSDEVMAECCLEMEESLNSVYRQSRVADKSIGPLEIRVVQNGTFEELMDYAISRGASINQYKVPRCVSFTPIMELLDSRVVSTHFSPSLPHWSPERRR